MRLTRRLLSHNVGETAYCFRMSQLVSGWNTESPLPLTKAVERLNLDHYNVFPKLKSPVYNPDELERDKVAYLNFFREFENCCMSVESKSLRLIVLKNHLKILCHLSISEDNFDIAVGILNREFLDEKIYWDYHF